MRIGKEQLRSVGARTEPADGIQRGLDEVCARLCERVGVQQLSQRLQQRERPSDTAGVPVGNPACRLLCWQGQQRRWYLLAPKCFVQKHLPI
jgi:hypothetical protein